MMTQKLLVLTAAFSLLALGGCAASYNPNVYQTGLTAQNVQTGRVLAVRFVTIQPRNLGGAAGTIGGAVAGSALGGDSHSAVIHGLGALAGAVVGGMAGQAVGNNMSRQPGEVVTVRLRSGRTVAVTQTLTPQDQLHRGEQVQLLQSGSGKTRVLPLG